MTPAAGGIVEDHTGKGLQAAWDEFAAPLRRVALALGLDGHRADDVLQEVYLGTPQWEPLSDPQLRGPPAVPPILRDELLAPQ